MNTSRYSSKAGGNKLLQKRIRSNVPQKAQDKSVDPVTQKNLAKTNPRMAQRNQRLEKQMKKQEIQYQMVPQQQVIPMMYQPAQMPGMIQGMPMAYQQQPIIPPTSDYQGQIAQLQQQIMALSQMTQLQNQLATLQGQQQAQQQLYGAQAVPVMQAPPAGIPIDGQKAAFLESVNQPQPTKSSPVKSPTHKKMKKEHSPRKTSPIGHVKDVKAQKKGTVHIERGEEVPSRTTRSGRPLDGNTPIKSYHGKNAAITKSEKSERKVPSSIQNQSSQGTIATTRTSIKTSAKSTLEQNVNPRRTRQSREVQETLRRSSRFQTTGSQQLMSLEDANPSSRRSPVKQKESAAPRKSPVQAKSQRSQGAARSTSSSPQVVRRSMRLKHSPPKQEQALSNIIQETRGRRKRLNSKTNTPILSQDQGNEESQTLQHLRQELEKTEQDYQTKKEREQKLQAKRNSRQNSSETRKPMAKKQQLPPTEDELMLFGDVIKPTNLQSEFDKTNPLETAKSGKFEAQTEIIQKNYEMDFTDDDEDKDMQEQLEKEKAAIDKKEIEILDEEKLKDYGMLFGLKDEEVKAMAEQQKKQMESLKDESILFGDGSKAEVVAKISAQNDNQILKEELKDEEKGASEVIILSQQSKSVTQNEVQNQDQAILFGKQSAQPVSQPENVEMDVQKKEFQQNEKPASDDTESVQEIAKPDEGKNESAQKIFDIDRQIEEIKKAIAIQQEVSARKLRDQREAAELQEKSEREEAERQIKAKEDEEKRQREIYLAKIEQEEREAAAAKEAERLAIEEQEREREAAEAAAAAAQAEAERQRQEELKQQQLLLEQQKQEQLQLLKEQQLKEQRERDEQIQREKEEMLSQLKEQAERQRLEMERLEEEERLREEQEEIHRQEQERLEQEKRQRLAQQLAEQQREKEKLELLEKVRQQQEQIKMEQEREAERQRQIQEEQIREQEAEERIRQQKENELRSQIEQQKQLLVLQQQQRRENELKAQIEELKARQAEQQRLKDQKEHEERERKKFEETQKLQEVVRQQQQRLLQQREQQVKEERSSKMQQLQAQKRELEERARMMQLNQQSQSQSVEQHLANQHIEISSDSVEDEEMRDESQQEDQEMEEQIKSVPAKPKYSTNLLSTLALSDKFALLNRFQQAVDQGINFLMSRQQVSTFNRIKENVEKSMHRQFNLAYFQQIMKVCPHLYSHKWEVKFDQHELIFSIPLNTVAVIEGQEAPVEQSFTKHIPSTVIHKRDRYFRQELAQVMLRDFEEFRSGTPQLSNFSIESAQRWPNMFDINDEELIKPIALAQFKDQPKEQASRVSVNDFITKHDTKQEFDKVVKTAQEQDMAMKEAAKTNYVPISSDSDRDSSEEDRARGQSFNVKHGISDATLNAIQYKQGVQKELRQKSQDTIEVETKQKKIDLLVKVAEMVRSQFFQCAQGSTLYFGKVVSSMLDSHRGNFVSKDHLKEQIITLCKILPQWLQVKQHSQGELMKCHKNLKISGHDIKVKITEYFSDDSGKAGNSQDQRLSKSCPPVQTTQHTTNIPHQMGAPAHHQAPSSAFKTSSAFQPFKQRPSQNEEQLERKDSINKNTFGNHPGGSSINLSNQQMKGANLAYPDSYNQQQQSSSGTYLSGPSGLSGGELEQIQPNHMPSKFLSPLKQMDSIEPITRERLESQNSIKFGNDSGFQQSYNENKQSMWQQSSAQQNYYRSTSMPNNHM